MELPGFGISEPNKALKGNFIIMTSCGSPSYDVYMFMEVLSRSPTTLKLSTSITQ